MGLILVSYCYGSSVGNMGGVGRTDSYHQALLEHVVSGVWHLPLPGSGTPLNEWLLQSRWRSSRASARPERYVLLKGFQKHIKNEAEQGLVQWLRLHVSSAGGPDSTRGQGTRIHIPQLRIHMLQLRPSSQVNKINILFKWSKTRHRSRTSKTDL